MQKSILGAMLFLFLIPVLAEARHHDRIDTSDLDRDPVESFPIPVLFGVEYDEVMPDFGDSRGGGTRQHEGQDFVAPQGTPVVSPTEAVVKSIGEGNSAGLYVYTANPGGETFRYMHLDTVADIEIGDELDPGDLIGTVGDTGNALEGSYHLHFEVRDEENQPLDPHDRVIASFSNEEKISFLRDILRKVDEDQDDYADFLVGTFPEIFSQALDEGWRLPGDIEAALEDEGVVASRDTKKKFDAIIDSIPELLQTEIKNGNQGSAVVLLQFYLIFRSEGPARDRLAAAGTTGYFGTVTEAAMLEFQIDKHVTPSGVYDSTTRNILVIR